MVFGKDKLKEAHQRFTDEVIENSEKITVDKITLDSIVEALYLLEQEQFSRDECVIIKGRESDILPSGTQLKQIPITYGKTVPENMVLVLHEKSISDAPGIMNIGLIRHPEGIVTVVEEDSSFVEENTLSVKK